MNDSKFFYGQYDVEDLNPKNPTGYNRLVLKKGALKEIDYRGWLVIESFGTSDPGLAMAANVWRNAFDTPEQVYREGIQFIRERIDA